MVACGGGSHPREKDIRCSPAKLAASAFWAGGEWPSFLLCSWTFLVPNVATSTNPELTSVSPERPLRCTKLPVVAFRIETRVQPWWSGTWREGPEEAFLKSTNNLTVRQQLMIIFVLLPPLTRGNNNTQCRETAPRLFPSLNKNVYFRIADRRVIFTPGGRMQCEKILCRHWRHLPHRRPWTLAVSRLCPADYLHTLTSSSHKVHCIWDWRHAARKCSRCHITVCLRGWEEHTEDVRNYLFFEQPRKVLW